MTMKFDVKISQCLSVLEKNLEEHLMEYKDASEVWTDDVIQELKNLRDAVDKKGLDASSSALYALFSSKPKDNRKEYSRLITSMKAALASGQKKITMDEDECDRVLNDNFDWRLSSKESNIAYSSRKK